MWRSYKLFTLHGDSTVQKEMPSTVDGIDQKLQNIVEALMADCSTVEVQLQRNLDC